MGIFLSMDGNLNYSSPYGSGEVSNNFSTPSEHGTYVKVLKL
jgi:hypothetical protein